MASWEFCKSLFYTIGFCLLLFVGIPVRIDKKEDVTKKAQAQVKFASFVKHFNKSYSDGSGDYVQRLAIFEGALQAIESLNADRPSADAAKYGLTEFADLTPQEFSKKFLKKHHHNHRHHNRSSGERHDHHSVAKRALIVNVPLKVDCCINHSVDSVLLQTAGHNLKILNFRRAKGVVTGVKDQGTCGACWAFSTVSAIESMLAIKTGKLKELSVQEVIDCARNGNLGCNGGDFCALLEWMVENDVSIGSSTEYPLLLKSDVCRWKKGDPGVKVAANFSCDYLVGNENVILETVANHGPVVVAVNAISWQYYLGGIIMNNCPGDPELLNHAVTIVGYDLTATTPHYIAKNSWGKRFGDAGYLKIAVGTNMCGIANEVSALDVL